MTDPVFDVTHDFNRKNIYRAIESVHRKPIWLAYADEILRLLKDVRKSRILDAGCGTSSLGVELAARGAEVTCLDADYKQLHFASFNAEARGVEVKFWLGQVTGTLPKEHFDVVVAAEVLEHLQDPEAAVLNLASALKPKGWLVVTVPHVSTGEKGDHEEAAKNPHRVICPSGLDWQNHDHLREYDAETLKSLLEKVGRVTYMTIVRGGDGRGATHVSLVAAVEKG